MYNIMHVSTSYDGSRVTFDGIWPLAIGVCHKVSLVNLAKWRSTSRIWAQCLLLAVLSSIMPRLHSQLLQPLRWSRSLPRPRIRPPALSAGYATISPNAPLPTTPYEVFDEPSKTAQRDRAVLRLRDRAESSEGSLNAVDYIQEELAERIADRIEVRAVVTHVQINSCCRLCVAR